MKFDAARLIADAGGPKAVASLCNHSLSSVYRWSAEGRMPSEAIATIAREKKLNLNPYFHPDRSDPVGCPPTKRLATTVRKIKRLLEDV